MAYYYKIQKKRKISVVGVQAFPPDPDLEINGYESTKKFDFTKYVLIELLDNVTPEVKIWEELNLNNKTRIIHKRIMVDAHRIHCRRAIVVCVDSEEAKSVVQRLSQTKIFERCVCAAVVQDILSDISLFEKQIIRFGDKKSQEQLIYVTDLSRIREPESLVQYLQKLFTPFGRILSIFVAKDKNGRAYPEGAILFSSLSEAFAAELAYDQCIVGLERLSVTVHHNILLSQCDLRTRLKEAQIKNRAISDASLFPSSYLHHKNSDTSNLTCEMSCRNSDARFIDARLEFTEIQENSCQDDVMHNLKCMETLDDTVPLLKNNKFNANMSDNLNSSKSKINYTAKGDFKSKAMDDSNLTDPEEQTTDSNEKSTDQIFLPDKLSLNQSSLKNNKLSKKSNMSKSMQVHQKILDTHECSVEKLLSPSGNNTTVCYDNSDKHNSSQIKKDSSLSQKLSLKKQRMHSILLSHNTSNNESTLVLPTTPIFETPKSIFKNSKNVKYQGNISEVTYRLFDTSTSDQCVEKENFNNGKTTSICNSLNCYNSSSSQKVSETMFCHQGSSSRKQKDTLKKECALESVANPEHCKNVESPLKKWLKAELINSTNNKVEDSKKNSRKIVCATPKRDVLVPVGCSHMTCDFCYPQSTNLLFGFY